MFWTAVTSGPILLMTLREFVDLYLRKKSGHLFPEKPLSWWEKNGFLQYRAEIYKLTAFLEHAVWPQRIWHIVNESYHPEVCKNSSCSCPVKWSTQTSSYPGYCSKQCSSSSSISKEKFRQTCLQKFGTSAPSKSKAVQETRRRNALAKYGVDHPSKTEEVKASIKTAFIEKYGVDNPAKVEEVKEKIKITSEERYGVPHHMQNQEILDKRTATNLAKFGVVSPTLVPEIKQKQRNTMLERYGAANPKHISLDPQLVEIISDPDKFSLLVEGKYMFEIVEETGLDISTLYNYLAKYQLNHLLKKDSSRSSAEIILEGFFNTHNIAYEANNRTIISPKELDFYLPKYNLAVELCGVYWHSEKFIEDKNYHYNKWKHCRDQGITLLTYFDDNIARSFDVIKSKLLYATKTGNFTKVGARELTIGPVDVQVEKAFFSRNHIQGFLHNRNVTLGAYLDDTLLAVICFTKRKDYLEITRFAVDIDYSVPGVFSKLLKHYIQSSQYRGKIISFSDNCHSNGNLYKSAGFRLVQELGPGYSYSMGGRPRKNRQGFMKAKIASKFNVDTSGKTESQLMNELGYQKVWDCGKLKWQLDV